MSRKAGTQIVLVPEPVATLLDRAEETLRLVRRLSEQYPDPRSNPKRSLREPCTQALFDHLPGLVPRSEFLRWTGITAEELANSVKGKMIDCYLPKGRTVKMYYKHEIARLTGFKL
jgi:hypothetical protein